MELLELLRTVHWRWPAAFALLLCPVAIAWFARRRRDRLLAYADAALRPWALAGDGLQKAGAWRAVLSWIAWLLLAAALAGPRWPLPQASGSREAGEAPHAADVMVVLDVSGSMRETDVRPDRATRARLELLDLLRRLRGERLGLVVLGGQAGLVLPLTGDHALFADLLEQVGPDLLEARGSDFAAALGVARKTLQASPRRSRAVLLVSDAEQGDLAGEPGAATRAALQALANDDIPVFMLAMSNGAAPEGEASPRSPDHAAWRSAVAGRFAGVADGDADWVRLFDQGIARLPSAAVPPEQARSWREGYRWPLLLAGFIWVLLLSPPLRWSRRTAPLLVVALAMGAGGLLPRPSHADQAPAASRALEQQAWAAWQAGQWSRAEQLYARLATPEGWLAAGAAALLRGDGAAAQRWSSRALVFATVPGLQADALSNLAHAHALQGRWDAAAEGWEAVLRWRPGDVRAATNLAIARHELARRARAAPMRSDLRGRRGSIAEGQILAEGEGGGEPPPPAGLGPRSARAEDAAGARLDEAAGPAAAAGAFTPDARQLASGLAKLQRIQDARGALLRGLVRQERAPGTPGLRPW